MKLQHSRHTKKVDNVTLMNLLFIAIVLCLHHVNYTQDYLWIISHRFINPYESGISQILQKLAVGGFLFLSGYKLAISKQLEPAGKFLLGRFLRIYPLYFLAVVLFSMTVYPNINGELPNLRNFAMHALALQAWLPNLYQGNYLTIWFVSNLLFCYFAFILLRCYLSKAINFLAAMLAIVLTINLIRTAFFHLYGINLFSGDFDVYFLFFAFGMFFSRPQERHRVISRKVFVVISSLLIVCTFSFIAMNSWSSSPQSIHPVLARLFILGFTLPAFYLLLKMPLNQESFSDRSAYIIHYIASASLCIFLFHRPIWTVMYQLVPEKSYLQSLFILGLGLPVIFITSHFLQSFYNSKLSLFMNRFY